MGKVVDSRHIRTAPRPDFTAAQAASSYRIVPITSEATWSKNPYCAAILAATYAINSMDHFKYHIPQIEQHINSFQ